MLPKVVEVGPRGCLRRRISIGNTPDGPRTLIVIAEHRSSMDPITLRLPTETLEEVDDEAEDRGLSRAEYLREVVENRNEHVEKLSDYESELEELRTEVGRLHRERRQILEQREEHNELVAAVQSDQTLSERKAKAGVGTRLKWWMFGMDGDS